MNKSMALPNIAIIQDLKNFLEEISSDSTKRSEFVSSPKKFSRRRLLPFKVMVLLIMNTLKRSLNVEINHFFNCILNSDVCCTKQAFCKARGELKNLFFHRWNDLLVDSFYRHYGGKSRRWKHFKLWAVDGTCIALPDKENLGEIYGYSSNGKGFSAPTCRASIIYDVLNQMVIKGCLHPYSVSEQTACTTLFENIDLNDSLLLFDRGYPSFWLIYHLLTKNTHFVFRSSKVMNKQVEAFLKSKRVDTIAYFSPSYKSLKRLKQMKVKLEDVSLVKVRLVKVFLDSGEIEVLITNLYDKKRYPKGVFKGLYNLRWGVETAYGHVKEGIQLQQFSGLRQVCIEQDFIANLFFYNLQSIIEKQCDDFVKKVNKRRGSTYKINKNVSWGILKDKAVKLFREEGLMPLLNELEKKFCRYLEPVRPGRKCPRKRKRTRLPDSKHYTLTNYKRAF